MVVAGGAVETGQVEGGTWDDALEGMVRALSSETGGCHFGCRCFDPESEGAGQCM